MAKEREITTKFKVDISDLKAGITEANRQIRLANSEFKAATAGMDKWSDSASGLQAKIKQLNTVIASEKDKLANLEEQYQRVADACGESSREAEELQIKINNQKAVVGKAEAELRKYTQQLDDLESGASEAADDVDKLGKEAKDAAKGVDDLGDEAGSASKDMDKLGDEAKDTADNLDDAEKSLKNLSDGFTVAKGAVATFAGNVLTGLGNSIKNGISNIMGLAEATREYREDIGKLETAFASANVSTKVAKDTYKEFYSVLGEEDRSVEAVDHLAKFVDTEEDMAKWTDICTGVWGTFGDSLPIEGLTEASNETMKTGKLTGVLADALNWAGVNEDEFQESLDACNSEQERQALITDTLNDLYDDAADAYRENNKSIIEARKANSDYTDSMATLGEKIEPITTKIREGFNKILQKVIELIDGVDMEAFAERVEAAFDTFVNDILPKILDGLKWIFDNKDLILTGIVSIGAAFLTWKVAGIISTITTAIKGMTTAQLALNTAMKGNVIGLVASLIVGLVAAFITLWNTSESFRNFWINLWENIKAVVSTVVHAIGELFSWLWDFIKSVWNGAVEFFTSLGEGIKTIWGDVTKAVGQFFSDCWEGIKTVWNVVVGWFSSIGEGIKNVFVNVKDAVGGFFSDCWEFVKSIWNNAVEFFQNLLENIKSVISSALNAIKKFFSDAWDGVKNIWNKAKGFFGDVLNGIKSVVSAGTTAVKNFFSSAWDGVKNIWNKATGFFSGIWSGIKNVFSSVSSWFGGVFSDAWENIKSKFAGWGDFWSGLWTKVKDKFSDIGSNIGSAISDSIRSGLNGVLGFIESAINKGIGLINGAIKLANLLPGVNVGTLSKISLPRLYKGGVLKKGQVGLLEGNGAEAVVPLENNKKWIRKTAKDMARELGMQKVINNGGTTSNQTVNNYNFTQNNTSPKALSRLDLYRQTQNQLDLLRG